MTRSDIKELWMLMLTLIVWCIVQNQRWKQAVKKGMEGEKIEIQLWVWSESKWRCCKRERKGKWKVNNSVFAICVSKLPTLVITDFLRKNCTFGFSKITHFHVFGQMSDFWKPKMDYFFLKKWLIFGGRSFESLTL